MLPRPQESQSQGRGGAQGNKHVAQQQHAIIFFFTVRPTAQKLHTGRAQWQTLLHLSTETHTHAHTRA